MTIAQPLFSIGRVAVRLPTAGSRVGSEADRRDRGPAEAPGRERTAAVRTPVSEGRTGRSYPHNAPHACIPYRSLLYQRPDRRLQAFVGWGAPLDAPQLLALQLLEFVKVQANGPPAIRGVSVPLIRDRENMSQAIDARVREALRLQDPNEQLADGLQRLAPRPGAPRWPVLWLDFGVYGDGQKESERYVPPSNSKTSDRKRPWDESRPWGQRLKAKELRAWWQYCCHTLAPACPPSVKVVVSLALVPKTFKGFEEKLETNYLMNDRLQHSAFHATLLPPLGHITVGELKEFLSEPSARCDYHLRIHLAKAIMARTKGAYAPAIDLLGQGAKGWAELLDRLTAGDSTSDPDDDEEL